ncbi:CDT1-like protein a, chloroplastic [Cucumis melo]|uniref:CDT1-like protein a, chloroplastic n=1 Tax=Cucumis melo TaxID=3656 RepID=A0A1S3BGW9_CUCME|nr:CDT1-like protein a, chloroplastic [Cucumis melo]
MLLSFHILTPFTFSTLKSSISPLHFQSVTMADASHKISSPSSTLPFKSKKNLGSNSKSLLKDPQSLSSKTPEKPAERTRKRKVALSIKEVKRAAQSVNESNRQLPHDLTTKGSKLVRRQMDSSSNESLSSRSKTRVDKKSNKLPEKFELLCKFFDCLDSAMRLLRFKGVASNFSNVCTKIEVLTDRRFSYNHLAQLKFILPEAIMLKKVVVFDERTSCMKPDLHISFNFDILESKEDQYMQLRKLFRTRLSEFASSHPEIDDVPKDLLPNPFNFRSQNLFPKTNPLSSVKTSIEQLGPEQPMPSAEGLLSNHHLEENQGFRIIKSTDHGPNKKKELLGLSHFSPSISRLFSQKVVDREMEKTHVETNMDAETSSTTKPFSPIKLSSNSTSNLHCVEKYASPICSSTLPIPTTPSNMVGIVSMRKEDGQYAKANDIDSTPAKFVSTPDRLMASTPAISAPKRSSMTPDDDFAYSTNKLVRRPPRSRSLVFDTPTKEDKNKVDTDVSLDDDILDVLSQSLVQSIREKERKIKEDQMPAITQAKRRQKMIAGLPKLFNAIFFLYHKRTVIKREELLNKIIVGSVDILDRREIEEQLDLLFELVPEWISQKSASNGGDVLVCINKLSNVELVRVRLEEAR